MRLIQRAFYNPLRASKWHTAGRPRRGNAVGVKFRGGCRTPPTGFAKAAR